MKIRIIFPIILTLFMTSCALPSFSQTKTVPKDLQYVFEIPSDPIAVSVTLEEKNIYKSVIGPDGGFLSVTGEDGTVFSLDIPAGALAVDTNIQMIPVSKIEGMPFGSAAYAVNFAPEGLSFLKYATLTIDPQEEIPVDQQLFFGYQGVGEDFALAIPEVNSSELKILIDHFSGYGVSKGLLADIEPVRQRIGGSAEKRIQSIIAEKIMAERQRILMGQEGENDLDLGGLFEQYDKEVVQPRLAAAGESCAAGRLALITVLGIERQRQLLGVNEGVSSFDNDLMTKVAEVCVKEEYELCRDEHIVHRIIPVMIGIERQGQLLGVEGASEAYKDYVRKCLTFELRFKSEANVENPGKGKGGWVSSVESKVKLQFNPSSWSINGQAPLVNTNFEMKVPGCTATNIRGGGTFEVTSMGFDTDLQSPEDELGFVKDIQLTYDPGNTTESFTLKCDKTSQTVPPMKLWTAAYVMTHLEESSLTDGFIAKDWEILGGDLFAQKEWTKEQSSVGTTESGTMKLYHKPE